MSVSMPAIVILIVCKVAIGGPEDQNAGMTRRYFGISPQTSYRWSTSYSRTHLEGLEDREASIQERATAFLFRGTGYGYSLTEGRLTLGQRQAAGTAWQQQIP